MDFALHHLIETLHRAAGQCVLAVTGGGTGAAALLLNVPGGSRTVLEVVVPYHDQALIEFLGRRPESFCSAATGRDMAVRAYERARWLAPAEPVVGVGCTASLVSERYKRGDHRFHLAIRTAHRLSTYSLVLSKGARDREGEEGLLDLVLLNALAQAFDVGERVPLPLLPGEDIQVDIQPAGDPLTLFLRGEVPAVCAETDGRLRGDASPPALVVPGSFNPLHDGHLGMAAAAARMTGTPVAFELSAVNVDKPALPMEEIANRVRQFTWRASVWLTRAPTFKEKTTVFPGAAFVIGADTAVRIVAPRYYGDSEERMAETLDHIRGQGCRFLVAGRAGPGERFIRLSDLALPARYADLFAEIPEAEFRVDVSSTRLRGK